MKQILAKMKTFIRNLCAIRAFNRACKAQEKGRYNETLSLLKGFESDNYFMAKAELFRAMAHHRLENYVEAVMHYDRFLDSFLNELPDEDRTYLHEYAMFFRSRAQAKIDPATPLHSSLEELRKIQETAPFVTRNEFAT